MLFFIPLLRLYGLYSGNAFHYAEMEQHSKAEQKRLLGKRIYSAMEWLDNRLPIHF
jgi:hypothetical protein